MIRVIGNTLAFSAFALALHVAVFALRPAGSGAEAAGEAGKDVVSLAAAPDSYDEMVAQWEAPPDLVQQTPEMTAPAPPSIEAIAQPEKIGHAPAPLPEMAQMATLSPPVPAAPDSPPAPEMTAPDIPPPPPADPELARHKPAAKPAPPKPAPPKKIATRPQKTQPPKAQAPKTQAPKTQARPPSTANKAAGQGGGVNAGSAQKAEAATLSRTKRSSLVAKWGASVRARIDRAKRSTRGLASGSVTVQVTVARSGALVGVRVTKSSGNRQLDAAALDAVRRARHFKAAPRGLEAAQYQFSLTLRFKN